MGNLQIDVDSDAETPQQEARRQAVASAPARTEDRQAKLTTLITERMVQTISSHYGRGPLRASTVMLDDLLVCRFSGGLIPIERTMLARDAGEEGLEIRREFQRLMKQTWKALVEELTDRTVRTVLADAELEPEVMVVVFLLGDPVAAGGQTGRSEAEAPAVRRPVSPDGAQ